jgi:uncharacterized phage protein (TIGR01671 family)
MKQEIKFRAWQDDQMLIQTHSGNYPTARFIGFLYEDSPIMQFTGLKDKDGVDIYADDIISDGKINQRVYSVIGGFGVKAPHWSSDMRELDSTDILIIQPLADAQTISYIYQSCSVIGNIYQNPKLLAQ